MKRWLELGFVLVACSATCAAQRVWTVRSGTPLQPVIDGASPGDRIELLDGFHDSFVLRKGLTIVGVGADSTSSRSAVVENVVVGELAVIAGIRFGFGIVLRACDGLVVLDDVKCVIAPNAWSFGSSSIDRCARVIARDSEFVGYLSLPMSGSSGLEVNYSNVCLVKCVVKGMYIYEQGYAGLSVGLSQVLLSDCHVVGGPGAVYRDPHWGTYYYGTPGPGIAGQGDLIVIDGCVVEPGRNSGSPSVPPAISFSGRPAVSLDTTLLGPTSLVRRIPNQPRVDAPSEGRWGSVVAVTLGAGPGDLGGVFVDVTSPGPTPLVGFEVSFWLSPSARFVGASFLDTQGEATFPLALPPLAPAVLGSLVLQGISVSSVNCAFGASAPLPLVVH